MKKVQLSDEAKKLITDITGVTFLPYTIMKNVDTTQGPYLRQLLEFYANTKAQLNQVQSVLLPLIKNENPELDYGGGGLPEDTVSISVIAIPAESIVKINGVKQVYALVQIDSTVIIEVSCEGYVTQKFEFVAKENVVQEVTLKEVSKEFTLTVAATPETAIVKLNGVKQNSITVVEGTPVTVEVSQEGYVTYNKTVTVTKTETIDVVLEKQKFLLTVTTTPSNATVKLNGVEGNSKEFEWGTTVDIEVSADHYVTQTKQIVVKSEQTIEIALERDTHTLTVTAPEGAEVKLNGVKQNSITVLHGTEVLIECTKPHYDTVTKTVTVNDDMTENIEMVLSKYTLTVRPVPSNAVIMINDVEQKSITVDYGTEVKISGSADHYVDKEITYTVERDETIEFVLEEDSHTISVDVTPSDAIVKLNGVEQKSITVKHGTDVTIECSKEHYYKHTETVQAVEDKTVTVQLKYVKHTVSVVATPENATIKINNKEQSSIVAEYGTELKIEVSAPDYETKVVNHTITEDRELTIDLVHETVTVTVEPTPANATVKIGGIEGKSRVVNKNEEVVIEVSAEGYITKSESITPTEDTNLQIVLEVVPPTYYTLTVKPTPADAIVKLNGKQQSSIQVEENTQVNVECSKEYYKTHTETVTVTENKELAIVLEKLVGTISVTSDIPDAVIKINNEIKSELTAEYGTEYTIEVSAPHYVTKTKKGIINKETESIKIDLVKEQHTINVITVPAEAVVKINGELASEVTVDYGTELSIECSAEHYQTKTVTHTVIADDTVTVNLERDKHTLTVTAEPSDAVIKIDGEVRNTIEVVHGTVVNVTVEKEHYKTHTEQVTMNEDIKLPITLEPVLYKVKVETTPVEAITKINGEAKSEIDAPYGTKLSIECSAENYVTKTIEHTVEKNAIVSVELEKVKHTVTVVATPDDATVKINNKLVNELQVEHGSKVTVVVEKEHYTTFQETYTITEDKTVSVNLKKVQHTVTLGATPVGSTIKINGEERNTITVDYGTEISIEVSKEHYVTHSEKIVVDKDITKTITLVLEQYTVTVVPIPEDATVKINDIEQKTITVDYGTEISIEVSKEHYVTNKQNVTVTENGEIPVTLALVQCMLTIVPTPEDAIVKLNDEVTSQKSFDYGTEVNIEVAKEGYVTVNQTHTVTKLQEQLEIELKLARVDITGTFPEKMVAEYPISFSCNVEPNGLVGKKAYLKGLITPANVAEFVYIDVDDQSRKPIQVSETGEFQYPPTPYKFELRKLTFPFEITVSKPGTYNVKLDVYDETDKIIGTFEQELKVDAIQCTYVIVPEPSDATVKINDTEQKQITVDKGTEIKVEVSKKDYHTVSKTVTVTETNSETISLVAFTKPSASSTLPKVLEKDVATEFDMSTIANDYVGQNVYSKFKVSNPAAITLEYYEPSVEQWVKLQPNEQNEFIFGTTSIGFSLSDATSKLRITGLITETVNVTSQIIRVEDKVILFEFAESFTISDTVPNLLTEDNSELLLEDGNKLILE